MTKAEQITELKRVLADIREVASGGWDDMREASGYDGLDKTKVSRASLALGAVHSLATFGERIGE